MYEHTFVPKCSRITHKKGIIERLLGYIQSTLTALFIMAIRVFDFFCGCGGTSAGLQAAGMEIVMGLDKDIDSQRTYQHNFPYAHFESRDIQDITVDSLQDHIIYNEDDPEDLILFSGCAPCQPFAQHKNGIVEQATDDDRFALLGEFGRFVSHYAPHLIFVENVPGIQRVKNNDGPFSQFLLLLDQLGYHKDYGVVNALNYGVPQRRRRLVLVASRLGPIAIPVATHGPNCLHPHATVRDWMSGLPPLKPGQEMELPFNHRAANLTEINRRRIAHTPIGGGRTDWPEELILDCHRDGHTGHTDVYGRISWDSHSCALTTKCTSLSNGRFGHPIENRAISVREAALLQTFDMDFRFFGGLNSTARQVGNAVPVKMAQCFGDTFIAHAEAWQRDQR